MLFTSVSDSMGKLAVFSLAVALAAFIGERLVALRLVDISNRFYITIALNVRLFNCIKGFFNTFLTFDAGFFFKLLMQTFK